MAIAEGTSATLVAEAVCVLRAIEAVAAGRSADYQEAGSARLDIVFEIGGQAAALFGSKPRIQILFRGDPTHAAQSYEDLSSWSPGRSEERNDRIMTDKVPVISAGGQAGVHRAAIRGPTGIDRLRAGGPEGHCETRPQDAAQDGIR